MSVFTGAVQSFLQGLGLISVVDLTPVSGVDDKDGKPPIIYGINDAISSHTKPQHSLAFLALERFDIPFVGKFMDCP